MVSESTPCRWRYKILPLKRSDGIRAREEQHGVEMDEQHKSERGMPPTGPSLLR